MLENYSQVVYMTVGDAHFASVKKTGRLSHTLGFLTDSMRMEHSLKLIE